MVDHARLGWRREHGPALTAEFHAVLAGERMVSSSSFRTNRSRQP
jgi:hypothetical protein